MKIEEHRSALLEHERNITRCINEGAEENQRNLGYNVSQASIEMFSIHLLKLKLVHLSVNYDHRLFKNSVAVRASFPFDFPEKSRILGIMRQIEEKRNLLCYGKRKPLKEVQEMIMLYRRLAELIGENHEQ